MCQQDTRPIFLSYMTAKAHSDRHTSVGLFYKLLTWGFSDFAQQDGGVAAGVETELQFDVIAAVVLAR